MRYFRNNDGFTLLEMLVVTAIMGMIGSLIFVQLQSARARARDAERESEIRTLKNALALYVVNAHLYPVYTGPITGNDLVSTELLTKDAISNIPADPFNRDTYIYSYDSTDGSTYTLTYTLETNSISGKEAGTQTLTP